MRALSDKWNPRIWLREWLNAPSASQREQSSRIQAGIDEALRKWDAASLSIVTNESGCLVGAVSQLADAAVQRDLKSGADRSFCTGSRRYDPPVRPSA